MKSNFISRFTPRSMTHEALESIFVQRHKLADYLVALIRESAITPAKHYTLLIGPRGIGKTHLVSLIYHRVRQLEDLRERLLIAWLREGWGLTSYLDLLLSILRALQQEYQDMQLTEPIELLYSSHETAQRDAEALLLDVIGNRTLLLLVENLKDVFDRLGAQEQKQFRAFLQQNDCCTIVATSQSLFNGVKLRESPFYGFFGIRRLEDLPLAEAVQLLAHIAELEGNAELASYIRTPRGRSRIQAVHHLAGGNHRLYIVFSEFLTRKSLDELVQPFMQMLDDLTPYYQARMAWLQPQQRKIVEYLSDADKAVSVEEIGKRCFLELQTAESQLKDLQEKGYVSCEKIDSESFYELQERLMRFCLEAKKQQGKPIRLFVDFLRIWYSQIELQDQLEGRAKEDKSEFPLIKDYETYIENEDLVRALELAEKLVAIRGEAQDWAKQGSCLRTLKRYEEALASFDKAIDLDPNYAWTWGDRGRVLDDLKRYEEALVSFDKAIDLDPNDAWAWLYRGWVLDNLGRYEEALACCDRAIELGYKISYVFFNRAIAILGLNRWDKGIAALDYAFQRIELEEEVETDDAKLILRHQFDSTRDVATWHLRLPILLELYHKHQAAPILGQGLVRAIPMLMSENVSDEAARSWQEVWQNLAGDRPEFIIPLRLLKTAVQYKEKKGDRRVLLQLPIEERKLLQPLLEKARSETVKPL